MVSLWLTLAFTAVSTPALAQRGGSAEAPAPSAELVHPDTASGSELGALPYVTPAILKAMLDQRPYQGMAALDAHLTKLGLTRQQLTELYERLFIPIDPNVASDREILMIPGVGNRLLATVKEQRPFATMDQFRREIGTMSGAEEVDRLVRYFTIE